MPYFVNPSKIGLLGFEPREDFEDAREWLERAIVLMTFYMRLLSGVGRYETPPFCPYSVGHIPIRHGHSDLFGTYITPRGDGMGDYKHPTTTWVEFYLSPGRQNCREILVFQQPHDERIVIYRGDSFMEALMALYPILLDLGYVRNLDGLREFQELFVGSWTIPKYQLCQSFRREAVLVLFLSNNKNPELPVLPTELWLIILESLKVTELGNPEDKRAITFTPPPIESSYEIIDGSDTVGFVEQPVNALVVLNRLVSNFFR